MENRASEQMKKLLQKIVSSVPLFVAGRGGEFVVMSDLDDTLAPYGEKLQYGAVKSIADFLKNGGIFIFNTGAPVETFYTRVVIPLIDELGEEKHLLENFAFVLSEGKEIYCYENGGYLRLWKAQGDEYFDKALAAEKLFAQMGISGKQVIYFGDAFEEGGNDMPLAGRVGVAVNVGREADANKMPPNFVNADAGYEKIPGILQSISGFVNNGIAGKRDRRLSPADLTEWDFDLKKQDYFTLRRGARVKVKVEAPGFVRTISSSGFKSKVCDVPLSEARGKYKAVLPENTGEFTFYWTNSLPDYGNWENLCYRQGKNFRIKTA